MTETFSTPLIETIPARDVRGPGSQKALREMESARRVVEIDGNVTTLTFVNEDGRVVTGWAKRNPNDDPMDPERGVRLATVRAYRKLRKSGWR